MIDLMVNNSTLKIGTDWKKNKSFLLALHNLGGVPRALEVFLQRVSERQNEVEKLSTTELELAYQA